MLQIDGMENERTQLLRSFEEEIKKVKEDAAQHLINIADKSASALSMKVRCVHTRTCIFLKFESKMVFDSCCRPL